MVRAAGSLLGSAWEHGEVGRGPRTAGEVGGKRAFECDACSRGAEPTDDLWQQFDRSTFPNGTSGHGLSIAATVPTACGQEDWCALDEATANACSSTASRLAALSADAGMLDVQLQGGLSGGRGASDRQGGRGGGASLLPQGLSLIHRPHRAAPSRSAEDGFVGRREYRRDRPARSSATLTPFGTPDRSFPRNPMPWGAVCFT